MGMNCINKGNLHSIGSFLVTEVNVMQIIESKRSANKLILLISYNVERKINTNRKNKSIGSHESMLLSCPKKLIFLEIRV